jgi:hypothetical protein
MKHQLKLLAAALAVVAAAPASAALIADGTTGNGDLFLSAWDGAALTSYTLNLGITESAFTGTSNLSFAADPNMAAFLAAVTPANVVWNVVAMDSTGSSNAAGALNYFGTGVAAPTTQTQPINSQLLNSATMNQYVGSVNNLLGSGNSIEHVSTGPTDFAYGNAGVFGPKFGGKITYNTVGTLGQNLNFYEFSSVTGTNLSKVSVTPFAGQWNLGSNGNLTYTTSVSAVPVPAAAWLFASGLMGLVGVSRRKNDTV